jgi:maltoporin
MIAQTCSLPRQARSRQAKEEVHCLSSLGAGRGYYSRPSVRVFVTDANWTKGFKGMVACPGFCNAQQGVAAGLQFENWW